MALRLPVRYALVVASAALALFMLLYTLHRHTTGHPWTDPLAARADPGTNKDLPTEVLDQNAGNGRGDGHLGNRRCQKTWRPQFVVSNMSALRFGFFNRPGFNALLKEADRRRWTIVRSVPAVLSTLQKIDFIFTHPSAYTAYPVLRELKAPHHLISAAQGMQAASGSKSTQVKVLKQHAKRLGCEWDKVRFLPLTFILSEPVHCKEFFARPRLSDTVWILKPVSRYGGAGIRLVCGAQDVAKLKEEFATCRRYRPESSQHDNRFIIQEYIERPLLLHSRKFDVRVYMLIASTQPFMLFYRPGYIRAALQPYSLNSTGDMARHLTNTHVQELEFRKGNSSAAGLAEHFWSLEQLQHYLDKHWRNDARAENFVKKRLVPFAKNAALYVFHAGQSKILRSPGTFQLVGLDIMVDMDFNCWFIEANNYPLWPFHGQFTSNLSLNMARDLFDLELTLHTNPKAYENAEPGDMLQSFELLYNEMYDCKHKKRAHFNPCTVFSS